jgi:hypothetical protein
MAIKGKPRLTVPQLSAKLVRVHKVLQDTLEEMIVRKNFSKAEEMLRLLDKQMLGLIELSSGYGVISND